MKDKVPFNESVTMDSTKNLTNEEVAALCESISRNAEANLMLKKILNETADLDAIIGEVHKDLKNGSVRITPKNEDVFSVQNVEPGGVNKFDGPMFASEEVELDSSSIEATGTLPSLAASIFGSNFEEK